MGENAGQYAMIVVAHCTSPGVPVNGLATADGQNAKLRASKSGFPQAAGGLWG